ncbi:unnamed protein product, partial [Prorocentrum cordatum]
MPDEVASGWQPFRGRVPRLSGVERGLVPERHRVRDFPRPPAEQPREVRCRRVSYRLAAGGCGIEVRVEVNVAAAFAFMASFLRFPCDGLEADWRVTDGEPRDLERLAAPKAFQLLDNSADPAHPQPPSFKCDLWPRQRRSLHWMVQQEVEGVRFTLDSRCFWWRHGPAAAAPKSAALEWSLDCRLVSSVQVWGGVLGDAIGYGKTSIALGLLDVRREGGAPPLPEEDEGFFFPSAATLICVPSNLHQQWVDEFAKFTGRRFRIVSLKTGADMKRATALQLASADVVLCNYQLLRGKPYESRRSELTKLGCPQASELSDYERVFGVRLAKHKLEDLPLDDLRRGTWGFIRCPEAHPWAVFAKGKPEKHAPAWQQLAFPVLEQFYWRRMIMDEFHELEALQPDQRASLQFMRAHHRWGLTGTPMLDAARHVVAMAALLRVDLAGPIRERALYLDAARAASFDSFQLDGLGVNAAAADLQRNQRLLILCSHFSAEALSSGDASEECDRVLEMKQLAVTQAKEALQEAMLSLEAFRALRMPCAASVSQFFEETASSSEERLAAVREFVQHVRGEARGQSAEGLLSGLKGGQGWKSTLRRAVREGFDPAAAPASPVPEAAPGGRRAPRLTRRAMERSLAACEEAAVQLVERLRTAVEQQMFLQRTLALLSDDSDVKSRSCSICYDEGLKLEELGITPCAHVFCLNCLREQITRLGKCGICRHELKPEDARPLRREIQDQASEKEAPDGIFLQRGELRKYGTKLGHIAWKLQQIKEQDSSAKCIVFCQWSSLLQKIAAAFVDFEIRHALLRGTVSERSRTLKKFRQADSSIDVLLLSLEDSASGTNLTCANHVLLVHPMNAKTQEQAVSFELQAIGRVRRWGQRRSEVHVWRFCTLGTVEEDLTRLHQRDIFARESERQEAAATSAQPQPPSPQPVPPRSRSLDEGGSEAAPTPPAAQAWSCPRCTLVNVPAAGLCDACELPRPGGACGAGGAAVAPAPAPAGPRGEEQRLFSRPLRLAGRSTMEISSSSGSSQSSSSSGSGASSPSPRRSPAAGSRPPQPALRATALLEAPGAVAPAGGRVPPGRRQSGSPSGGGGGSSRA